MIVAVFSLPLAAICVWAIITSESVIRDLDPGSTPRSFRLAAFQSLSTELFGAAASFLLLAFIWAAFQPRWVKRFLLAVSRHVWMSVVLLFGILALAVYLRTLVYVR